MAITREVLEEIDLLAARLQVERDNLYNEYDRLKSEAELRFSLLAPVILLTAALVLTWTWQAILGLAVPVALFAQGIQAQRGARRLVVTALVNGVVESPTAQAVDRYKEDWLSLTAQRGSNAGMQSATPSASDATAEDGAPAPPAGPASAEPAP